jgi:hypothetical protein
MAKDTKRIYEEWVPILERAHKVKVLDPDGLRAVIRDGRRDEPMTRKEAERYFIHSTMTFNPDEVKWA